MEKELKKNGKNQAKWKKIKINGKEFKINGKIQEKEE